MLEHGRQVFFVREMVYALALVALCPSHPVLLRGASRRSFLFSPPLVLIKSWRATGAGWGGMRTLIPFFLLIVEIRGDYARYSSTNESTSFCVDRSVCGSFCGKAQPDRYMSLGLTSVFFSGQGFGISISSIGLR